MANETDIQKLLKERFASLPKPVQDAISSEDNSKHLRELADNHKLHIDQWERLENEVMMALFGVTPIDELEGQIQKQVGVTADVAKGLTADISKIVFSPIREELERQLEHPEAKAAQVSGVEAARTAALAESASSIPASAATDPTGGSQTATGSSLPPATSTAPIIIPPVTPAAPATPPPPAPTEKAVRAPVSESYHAGQPSSERASVHDDPYREPPA